VLAGCEEPTSDVVGEGAAVAGFRDFEHAAWEDPDLCGEYQDCLVKVTVQVIEPMLDALRVSAGDRLLDVATGPGLVAGAAARRGATAVGVDFSAEMLRRAATIHPELTFQRGAADVLPFASGTFDVVLCNFGVPHFPDPQAFFREGLRVLRPAGRFAYTVWAAPTHTKGFEAIYNAVEQYGSLDVGLPPGPNFFAYADENVACRDLAEAGFEEVTSALVAQEWVVAAAEEIFDAVLNGTVRAAALLKRQPPEALDRIRVATREALAPFEQGGSFRVPMPAVLVHATKPPAR
jgi:ubiquinone/menaquinone biosynthesis C-methylase UbiE